MFKEFTLRELLQKDNFNTFYNMLKYHTNDYMLLAYNSDGTPYNYSLFNATLQAYINDYGKRKFLLTQYGSSTFNLTKQNVKYAIKSVICDMFVIVDYDTYYSLLDDKQKFYGRLKQYEI
jgi:hypothetical protein